MQAGGFAWSGWYESFTSRPFDSSNAAMAEAAQAAVPHGCARPSPPARPMTFAPDLYPTRDGFKATCGKCLRHSPEVIASDDVIAWASLVTLGWRANRRTVALRPQLLCPTCTTERLTRR
jgi:hypothetical protein